MKKDLELTKVLKEIRDELENLITPENFDRITLLQLKLTNVAPSSLLAADPSEVKSKEEIEKIANDFGQPAEEGVTMSVMGVPLFEWRGGKWVFRCYTEEQMIDFSEWMNRKNNQWLMKSYLEDKEQFNIGFAIKLWERGFYDTKEYTDSVVKEGLNKQGDGK